MMVEALMGLGAAIVLCAVLLAFVWMYQQRRNRAASERFTPPDEPGFEPVFLSRYTPEISRDSRR